jgi:hypothetical protein
MKKLPINHWTINNETEGLLFFAQRMSEMLFDFTIDTYKSSALNTLLLCYEARQTIDFIENNSIDEKHLEYILEELNWSYPADIIVKEILGDTIDLYFPITNLTNKLDIKLKLEILINKLTKDYFKTLKKLLSIAVKTNQKKDINFLTNNFIIFLTNSAYHQNYIYQKTLAFFFSPKSKINNQSKIDEFLNLFVSSINQYDVTFIASRIFNEIERTCKKFDITITNELSKEITSIKNSETICS